MSMEKVINRLIEDRNVQVGDHKNIYCGLSIVPKNIYMKGLRRKASVMTLRNNYIDIDDAMQVAFMGVMQGLKSSKEVNVDNFGEFFDSDSLEIKRFYKLVEKILSCYAYDMGNYKKIKQFEEETGHRLDVMNFSDLETDDVEDINKILDSMMYKQGNYEEDFTVEKVLGNSFIKFFMDNRDKLTKKQQQFLDTNGRQGRHSNSDVQYKKVIKKKIEELFADRYGIWIDNRQINTLNNRDLLESILFSKDETEFQENLIKAYDKQIIQESILELSYKILQELTKAYKDSQYVLSKDVLMEVAKVLNKKLDTIELLIESRYKAVKKVEPKTKPKKIVESRRKKVIQYTLEDEVIAEHSGIIIASEATNSDRNGIAKCCNGDRFSCNGFRWSYKDKELIFNDRPKKKRDTKRVYQFTLDGVLIAEYDSVREACEATGTGKSGILKCCNGRSSKSNGFKWQYVN